MNKKIYCLTAILSLMAADAISCQFHEPTENNNPQFPPLKPALHPVMLQHFSPPVQAPIQVSLSVSNDAFNRANLLLSYEVHPDYHNVKADIIAGKGVRIMGRDSLYLTRLKEDKQIQYRSGSGDDKRVRVRISAVRNGVPVIVEKRIDLTT